MSDVPPGAIFGIGERAERGPTRFTGAVFENLASCREGAVSDGSHMGGSMLRLFGLHPVAAAGVIAVDVMLFGATSATLGTGWVVSVPVGAALGIAIALIQVRGSPRDDLGVAVGKGILVALLTAIPTPLPSVIVLGAGAAGARSWLAARNDRRKLDRPAPR